MRILYILFAGIPICNAMGEKKQNQVVTSPMPWPWAAMDRSPETQKEGKHSAFNRSAKLKDWHCWQHCKRYLWCCSQQGCGMAGKAQHIAMFLPAPLRSLGSPSPVWWAAWAFLLYCYTAKTVKLLVRQQPVQSMTRKPWSRSHPQQQRTQGAQSTSALLTILCEWLQSSFYLSPLCSNERFKYSKCLSVTLRS